MKRWRLALAETAMSNEATTILNDKTDVEKSGDGGPAPPQKPTEENHIWGSLK